jgi:alkylation response protein AidB-like acyl-CoA dehydrogenase
MDLRYSEVRRGVRAELRAWLDGHAAHVVPEPSREDWPARVVYDTDWQKRLFDGRLRGMSWPKEYGGREAPPSEQLIFLEECSIAKAPYVGVNFVGTLHAGPTLIAEGTHEQKERPPPEDPARGRGVVPVLLRARRRLRPRRLQTRAIRDGERLRRERAQDLVQLRPRR